MRNGVDMIEIFKQCGISDEQILRILQKEQEIIKQDQEDKRKRAAERTAAWRARKAAG